MTLRPEHKSLALVKELIFRITKPGDIVVDLFAGTFSTASACPSLPNHRVFVGCDKDEDAYNISAENLRVVYAENMLSGKSDNEGTSATKDATGLYLGHSRRKQKKIRVN